jgi:hypothetical protein
VRGDQIAASMAAIGPQPEVETRAAKQTVNGAIDPKRKARTAESGRTKSRKQTPERVHELP